MFNTILFIMLIPLFVTEILLLWVKDLIMKAVLRIGFKEKDKMYLSMDQRVKYDKIDNTLSSVMTGINFTGWIAFAIYKSWTRS